MNILFFTMATFAGIDEHSIYPDLIRALASRGHKVYVILPSEARYDIKTFIEKTGDVYILHVKTGNLFNVSFFTKLISRAEISGKYIKAIQKYTKGVKFDLVLYSTPPTTFYKVVSFVKKRDGAISYLMLKDIFPQNAVDLGMIGQNSIAYRILRRGEKKLYLVSDYIGCMSPANVEYLYNQDPWIDRNIIDICPNALEVIPKKEVDRVTVRNKYDIPDNKIVFVYGGGIGKPQGICFFEKCIKKIGHSDKYMFVILGSGPYVDELRELSKYHSDILKVISWLPVNEFYDVVAASDVGLILLDYRFKIPNFPSRLLAYLQAGIPVLSATDVNSDVGEISEDNGFGYWCESNNVEDFIALLNKYDSLSERVEMGKKARAYFEDNYDASKVADGIITKVMGDSCNDGN